MAWRGRDAWTGFVLMARGEMGSTNGGRSGLRTWAWEWRLERRCHMSGWDEVCEGEAEMESKVVGRCGWVVDM